MEKDFLNVVNVFSLFHNIKQHLLSVMFELKCNIHYIFTDTSVVFFKTSIFQIKFLKNYHDVQRFIQLMSLLRSLYAIPSQTLPMLSLAAVSILRDEYANVAPSLTVLGTLYSSTTDTYVLPFILLD